MGDTSKKVRLKPVEDGLLVLGDGLLRNRSVFLYLRGSFGGFVSDGGWKVPWRGKRPDWVVLRVHRWMERQGFEVDGQGSAGRAIEDERTLQRSFQRTTEAARELKAGYRQFDVPSLRRTLAAFGWRKARTLRPHQVQGAAHALLAINAANFSVPGAGKTVTTLAVAVAHMVAETVDLVVVVGPLASFGPWEQETAAAVGDNISVVRVRGSASQREAAYDCATRGHLLLLGYATATNDQIRLVRLFRERRVMLVVDESHRVKRFRGGSWAPALVQLAQHAQFRHILSGTPMPQSGKDLYSQLNILWPGERLTGTRDAFASAVERDFDEVLRRVGPFISRTPKDALGLKPYVVTRHAVNLDGTQAEVYRLIVNRFRTRLADAGTWQEKLDRLKRCRPIRLLQAASNPSLLNGPDDYYDIPRMDDRTPTLMERLAAFSGNEWPAKSQFAVDLVSRIAERGEKVVCWSNFVANLRHFRQLVTSKLSIPCFQIDGSVPARKGTSSAPGEDESGTRESIIRRFLMEPGPAVLVTNPASCSESISLHSSCHNAIYLDRTYDCAQFLQSIDRIHRLGLPPDATVEIHILLATQDDEDTIDHLVDRALEGKNAKMKLLLEGAALNALDLADEPILDAEGNASDLEALLRYLLGE